MRPALYGAYHEIRKIGQPTKSSPMEVVDVVGPVCESADFLAKERLLPRCEQGEYLAIMDAGAYGFSMASSYNARPLPAEVLAAGKKWNLIRSRQSYPDLVRDERTGFEERNPVPAPLVPFVKLQGSGNDFIVIDNRSNAIIDGSSWAKELCPRKTGIGADGLLLLEKSQKADYRMRIFNPDGSEAQMCGNGARCRARFGYLKGIVKRNSSLETLAGIIRCWVLTDTVRIEMEKPRDLCLNLTLPIKERIFEGHYLDTGVPHFVLFTSKLSGIPLGEIAPPIRNHSKFGSQGTNVDYVEVGRKNTIKARTFERGVEDETLACGTGAVASALVSKLVHGLSSPIMVQMKGGNLLVHFEQAEDGSFSRVLLEGEAQIVFEGRTSRGGLACSGDAS